MKRSVLLFAVCLVAIAAQALPFVTTTSPQDYPIHWYQLKNNGMYIYSGSDAWHDLEATSTASTADAFLWCFVTTSSGKTVLYNKREMMYMRHGYSFIADPAASGVNYVEEGSGNSFYVCHKEGATTYYLDYDVDNGLHTPSWKLHACTVVEVKVEEEAPTPDGELLLNLEVFDEYCMLSAVYTGTEECTVKLNVNGNDVNNPCRIARSGVQRELDVIATVTFNGMDPLVNHSTIIIPPLGLVSFTGEIVFDVTKNADNYVIDTYYAGSELCSIKLFANGQQVSNPYTVARTGVDQTIKLKAIATASGKIPLEKEEVITVLKYEEPDLDLTFRAFAQSSNLPNPTGGEGCSKLFDKNPNTKWRVNFGTNAWQTVSVDFTADQQFYPAGYVMTTANDAKSNPNRNPKAWKIYGKPTYLSDDWELLATVTDGVAAGLGTANATEYTFDISGITQKYFLFRFEVTDICGVDGDGNHCFQLAEFRMRGKASLGKIFGDVNNDSAVNVSDVNLLVSAALSGTCPDGYDLNDDNTVNVTDINLCVSAVLNQK